MNRAARRMMARDPLISSAGLRFLLMANISAKEFCAGFRTRTSGECLALSTPSAMRLPVARRAKMHGGRGGFSSSWSGKILLTYRTDRFSYVEEIFYDGPCRGMPNMRLTFWNQQLPDTVVAALPGRLLMDLVAPNRGVFSQPRVPKSCTPQPWSVLVRPHSDFNSMFGGTQPIVRWKRWAECHAGMMMGRTIGL